jgi:hypothetical protein
MDAELKQKIHEYFRVEFAEVLKAKIEKGYPLDDFNVNPFTLVALSGGVLGEPSISNMARALIYPRVLGTSLNTSFGDKMQKLCVAFLGAEASGVPGMDFHFDDKVSGGRVYMQLKAGPNTINKDDVDPILVKMLTAYRLLRQNMAGQNIPLFAMGIAYGTIDEISGHYKKIQSSSVGGQEGVPIYIGKDLWHRITGNPNFYVELVNIFVELFKNEDSSEALERAVSALAIEIQDRYFTDGKFDPNKI